ncbi:sensor histidine kinase [Gracilinema caldarium]|uniref:sensor histidine kinase n=1 Tax=Gracilinema caldarium TaxID=215591 RepID=UPI0026EA255E|nr:sensor histidine kinase [Gracilinema caldarium]
MNAVPHERPSLLKEVSFSVFKVFFAMLLCISLGWSVFAFFSVRNAVHVEDQYITTIFRTSLNEALWEMDSQKIRELAQLIVSNTSLSSLEIIDEEGILLFSYSKNQIKLFGYSVQSRFEHIKNGYKIGESRYSLDYILIIKGIAGGFLFFLGAVLFIFFFMQFFLRNILKHKLQDPLDEIAQLISTYGVLTTEIKEEDETRILFSDSIHKGYIEFEGIRGLLLSLRDTILNQFKELKRSIAERDILMRELNHRIRNNLQLLSAIINQQRAAAIEAATDETDILTKLLGRIDTIAEAYGLLIETRRINGIEMASYIASICGLSKEMTGNGSITCIMDIQPMVFPIDYAVASGLIIFELISNAAEHAYEGGSGAVRITLRQEGDLIILSVADQGKGCPFTIANPPNGTLGFRFVAALSSQMKALIHESSKNGFEVVLEMKRKEIEDSLKREIYSR